MVKQEKLGENTNFLSKCTVLSLGPVYPKTKFSRTPMVAHVINIIDLTVAGKASIQDEKERSMFCNNTRHNIVTIR